MKIKKFKVALRRKEILKNLKLTAQIKDVTPQLEESVLKEIDRSPDYLCPSSVFETFPAENAAQKFVEFLPVLQQETQGKKPVAVSVIAVTIGSAVEKEIELAKKSGENQRAEILHSLALEACSCSLNFIYRIISEEAAGEECSLMPLEKLSGDNEKNVLRNMNTESVNISIDDSNQLRPVYSSAAIARWLPKVKK